MEDYYQGTFDEVDDPGTVATEIVPDDDVDLAVVPKGIYVGTGGDIAMIGARQPSGSAAVIWRNIPSGALIPFRPRRILASGTTASDLIAVQ